MTVSPILCAGVTQCRLTVSVWKTDESSPMSLDERVHVRYEGEGTSLSRADIRRAPDCRDGGLGSMNMTTKN
jgi:hypothetical protein